MSILSTETQNEEIISINGEQWAFTQTFKSQRRNSLRGCVSGYGRKIGKRGNPVGAKYRIFQRTNDDGSVDVAWQTDGRVPPARIR